MDMSPPPRPRSHVGDLETPEHAPRRGARPMSAPARRVTLNLSPLKREHARGLNLAAAQAKRTSRQHREIRPKSAPKKRADEQEEWLQDRMNMERTHSGPQDPWLAQLARLRLSSLPAQTRRRNAVRGFIEDSAAAFQRTHSTRFLVATRGEHGDWRSASRASLNTLISVLLSAERISDATRVLSDLPFLQRRLQLGSLPEMLDDFDLVEAALEELVVSEPFEQRSAESSGALARRMYLVLLRAEIDALARRMQNDAADRCQHPPPCLT